MSKEFRSRTLQLVINSKDREDYNSTNSTNFVVKLQNPINFDILAYGLESVCIPKTNYLVTSGEFVIKDSVGDQNVVIQNGNYSVTSLVAELLSVLNGLGNDTYTVVFNPVTFKLVITSNFNGFTLNPNASDFPVVTIMGFDNNRSFASVLGVLESFKVVDLSGIKNVYIKIAELSAYMRDTKNLSSNFKVDYGCAFGSIVYFANQSKYLQYYETAQNHIRRTDKFSVRLVDETGDDIDLNGSDWSMVLRFFVKDLY
jgi:hypothetical protein